MDDETPEEKKKRLELERTCASLGRVIGQCMPPGQGFVFAMFDFGTAGNIAYISNAQREDMIKALGELRDKLRRQ